MQIARILSAGLVLSLLIGGRPAAAENWSLQKLNPFAKKQQPNRTHARQRSYDRRSPTPIEKFNAGTKKFFADAGTGTKKLLTNTRDALTWKKPAAKKSNTPHFPWVREPAYRQHQRSTKKEKKSWLSSLFRREEALPSRSLDDFMGAERLDP